MQNPPQRNKRKDVTRELRYAGMLHNTLTHAKGGVASHVIALQAELCSLPSHITKAGCQLVMNENHLLLNNEVCLIICTPPYITWHMPNFTYLI